MAAAEHQRPGAVEVPGQPDQETAVDQPQQYPGGGEQAKRQPADPGDDGVLLGPRRRWFQPATADQRRRQQRQQLHADAGEQPQDQRGGQGQPAGEAVAAEFAAQVQHRIGHHHHRQPFQAADQAVQPGLGQPGGVQGHHHHDQEGRQGEAQERRHAAGQPAPMPADGETELAGRRPGQKLCQGQQTGVGGLVQPAQPHHEAAVEIAHMGGGTTEADTAQPQEFPEYLPESHSHSLKPTKARS